MGRPGPAPALLVVGGTLVVAGSLLGWAVVALDLSPVFARFPRDYRQVLRGPELTGGLTIATGAVAAVGGAAVAARPRLRQIAAAAAVLAAVAALMTALYAVIRLRLLALDAVLEAARRDLPALAGASVRPGVGPFVVLLGSLLAMAGGVLTLAGRGIEDARRRGPEEAASL